MTFLYLDGPTYTEDAPSTFAQIVFVAVIVIAFLLRKNPYLWWIWFVIKCFFIALAATLIMGRVKKGVKDWLKD